jgi:peptidyl-prolyl cis-trans isomerase D
MLSAVRKLLSNWVARVFFGLLVVVFVFWGVQNVFTMVSASSALVTVAGAPVDAAAVAAGYQQALGLAEAGGQPAPDVAARQQMAERALATAEENQELKVAEQSLGVSVPDASLRQIIDAVPAFQLNGVFDKATFESVLAANNKSPADFLSATRDDLAKQQYLGAVDAGAVVPPALVRQLFDYIAEQRSAELAFIPYASQTPPAAPADAVLLRFWRNNQALFTLPEYRTVKIVVLSPQLLAPQEVVSDAQLEAIYDRAAGAAQPMPERSVQVITAKSADAAAKLVAAWNGGAGWAAMQTLAGKVNAQAVELDKTTQTQIPSQALAQAVFAAQQNVVSGPVQGPFGFYVFKVTDVSSTGPDKASALAGIKQAVQLNKAQADVAQDADNLQDALAAQTPLDQLPGNLGLTAVSGTMDANGHEPDGTRAPIPGDDGLRAAIVKAAFAATAGAPAQMMNGPAGTYFAVSVQSVTPPAVRPFAQAHDAVLAAWSGDQLAREAEVKAAAMLQAVNSGQNFQTAAAAAGVTVSDSGPLNRNEGPDSGQAGMAQVLFGMTPGQALMQKANGAFLVALLNPLVHPTPDQDPEIYKGVQTAAARLMQSDIDDSLLLGLEQRYPPSKVNGTLLTQIYQ